MTTARDAMGGNGARSRSTSPREGANGDRSVPAVAPELASALARAGDGAFVIGADGRIVLWNRAAERILGHPARATLGRPCCEVFEGLDDGGNRLCYRGCHVMSLVRMGEAVQSFEMRTRTRAGQAVWLSISTLSLPEGDARGLTVHLFRDITATKAVLEAVRERLTPSSLPPADGVSPLTRRELEILSLMKEGLGTRAAAQRLNVSPATVRNHAQNILEKLGVHSRLEAVAYASTHRLLP